MRLCFSIAVAVIRKTNGVTLILRMGMTRKARGKMIQTKMRLGNKRSMMRLLVLTLTLFHRPGALTFDI